MLQQKTVLNQPQRSLASGASAKTEVEQPTMRRLRPVDNWRPGLGVGATCSSCMYYVPGRCRRHAPKVGEGYPAVYSNDFCGDHKVAKESLV